MKASSYVAVAVLALIVVIGWVVDGGGQILAHQRATTLAQDAARVGANAVSGHIVATGSVAIDPTAARAAAEDYVHAAGATAEATVTADTVTVTVTTSYDTIFSVVLGLDVLYAEATASAQLVSR
ncbi:pilus assembly protein TadG-related protein [Microbacterium sp. No. 7]|uniref:pilus assembly protein TadG-related protein n=1 Tax=Microbacterium sp. No. 7 TaxID=1714373 RepID=UPI0006D1D9A9|nr:pilus assembly protein TadG-related protein [Microbacterium sp. No. 7]ALJ21424.1 hypothetical protein AOA12_16580 [Microbacterium sp. No. 7]